MKAFWTALALLGAIALQSGLSNVLPAFGRTLDPFLIVLVYCGLVGGETHAMVAGGLGGWIQDAHFGSRVLGLSGLSKVMVGFGVGLAGSRFQLTEPGPRALVLVAAAVLDALIVDRLAAAFDVGALDITPAALALRALVNAGVGVLAYEVLERRFRHPIKRE
ncbi:MAG TPA: hypothetical protein VII13_13520 [Vicinamibacteria bacterium]